MWSEQQGAVLLGRRGMVVELQAWASASVQSSLADDGLDDAGPAGVAGVVMAGVVVPAFTLSGALLAE